MQKNHGAIIPVNVKDVKSTLDESAQKIAIKFGEWNTTEVLVKNGTIVTSINGVPVSTCAHPLKEGSLGFQSDGTEVHFKDILFKALESSADPRIAIRDIMREAMKDGLLAKAIEKKRAPKKSNG